MVRVAEIITPLKADTLLFYKLTANEGLSKMFTYEVDLLSDYKSIDFSKILSKPMTIRLRLPNDSTRFFHGYVARFGLVGRNGRYYQYRATLRPWLWFLTRKQDCRIFQEKTAVDIVKNIFSEHSLAQFELQLSEIEKYPRRKYCVQYDETDFHFISRLLEQEGISYFFKHEKDKHSLVLIDSSSSYTSVSGYEEIPYISQTEDIRADREAIQSWSLAAELQASTVVSNDYNFELPNVKLEVHRSQMHDPALGSYEIYEYPGEYANTAEGDHYLRSRFEQIQNNVIKANGSSEARGLTTGHTFKLKGFPRDEQNGIYLVTNTVISIVESDYEGIGSNQGEDFQCNFEVARGKNTWRPARLTPKPVMRGPQTAVVVGPKNEEIFTDQYGRVKVLFHWDRKGRTLLKDTPEESSCWIRVSQPWAGKNFGFIAIPRVGEEVVIDFLDGNPDRPLITGSVYNASQMPPWDLLKHKERTGIVTRSTEGGNPTTANELHFDDTKNHELIFLHAENDILTTIEQDATYIVGHDHTETIRHDRTSTVHKKDTLTVKEEGQVLRIEKGGQDEFIIGKRLFDLVGDEANTLVGERDTFITVSDTYTTPVETRVITTQADHIYGDELNISVGAGGSTTSVLGTVTHNAVGPHKLFAPSFDFTASGNVTYNCHIYTRNCYNVQDNIYGPSKNTQIGPNVQIQLGSSSYSHFGAISEVEAGPMILKFVAGVQISSRLGLDVLQYGGPSINTKMGPVFAMNALAKVVTCPFSAEFNAMKIFNGGGSPTKAAATAGQLAAAAIAQGSIPAFAAVIATTQTVNAWRELLEDPRYKEYDWGDMAWDNAAAAVGIWRDTSSAPAEANQASRDLDKISEQMGGKLEEMNKKLSEKNKEIEKKLKKNQNVPSNANDEESLTTAKQENSLKTPAEAESPPTKIAEQQNTGSPQEESSNLPENIPPEWQWPTPPSKEGENSKSSSEKNTDEES